MNFVLVDFESVQPESLPGLDREDFHVLVFVGGLQVKVPFPIADAIQRLGNRAGYIKITGTGPNALDFHIAFYIGKFATENPGACFFIVSKDTGFDPLIQHLKTKSIRVIRVKDIRDVASVPSSNGHATGDLVEGLRAMLGNPKGTKPRTVKSLTRAILAWFPKHKLTEEQASAVIAQIAEQRIIAINGTTIVYPPLAPSNQLTMLQ